MKVKVPAFIACNRPGTFLVGGSVRDLARGLTPLDYDIAVSCDPQVFAEEAARKTGGRIVLLGKDRFTVYRVAAPQRTIDITPFKGRNIRQDLMARDFTINALACDLSDGQIIDVAGGLADLRAGLVRMISPAVFMDDPVRLIRAFRMAATLNFKISTGTVKAIRDHAANLSQTAGERIWAELIRILACPDSYRQLQMMAATRILSAIFPEWYGIQAGIQNHVHATEGLDHALEALRAFERLLGKPDETFHHTALEWITVLSKESRALLKMSILLHDIGKPGNRIIDAAGKSHFYGHALRGAELVQSVGRRLRMSNRQREWIASLVRRYQRPLFLFLAGDQGHMPPAKALGRFFRQCGRQVPHLLIQAMADAMGSGNPEAADRQAFIDFIKTILADYFTKGLDRGLPPLLTGLDLIQHFKLQPSPLIGTLLRRVQELHMAGAISNRQQALEWVAGHLKSIKKKPPALQAGGDQLHIQGR